MTRGRKKDLSIPPSRALTQQRDYRARRAQYVNELEERCKRAEEENERLKAELELARTRTCLPGSPSSYGPETAKASAELIQQLSAASASLARFQQLASTNFCTQLLAPPPLPVLPPSTATSFPAPASSPPFRPNQSACSSPSRNIRLPPIESFAGGPPLSWQRTPMSSSSHVSTPSQNSSLGSDCCNGYLDCTDLIEEDTEKEKEQQAEWQTRTSRMRSTSDGSTRASDLALLE